MATCGEAMVRLLEQYGVDMVFGIPGVHTLELYRGLAASPIRHVTPRHEQGAAFMADAYARVSGKPGVCILITGAGLTNAATPIASAYHDSVPLLVLSSATRTADNRRGHGALHDLPDQQAFMRTITADSIEVRDPSDLPEAFAAAFSVFESSRPRPVHIGVPIDVLDLPADATRPRRYRSAAPVADRALVGEAATLLVGASRPLLLLGGGAARAGSEAIGLAERVGAPIGVTVNAKGAVPADHPLSVGSTLTIGAVYEECETADVVVAAGTEFSETDYFYAPGGQPPRFRGALIRIDIDAAQLAKRRAATIALHGDAAATIAALADACAAQPRPANAAAAATRAAALRDAAALWEGCEPFLPFLKALRAAAPRDAIVTADSTQPAYVAHHWWPAFTPRSYIAPGGFGTLGPALPMAIGAKLAAPQRAVVCLAGDGGLLFTIQELAAACDLGLPIAVVVWQNNGYGEIRDSMDRVGVAHVGTDATARDYLKLAEGFGASAVRVGALADLAGALAAAFAADRPTLIEVAASAR
jgi:thiamine pyrophosphate-dependent acetolactate synthase large subunit-like protein